MAAIGATALLLGCGNSNSTTSGTQSPAGSTAPPTAEAKAPVALHLNQGSYSISSSATTISGTVSKGASVAINGHPVSVHSGHWRETLHLAIGSHPFEVAADMAGRASARAVIQITRHHSAAELEALARERAHRAELKNHAEAERRERKERQEREEQEKHEKESRPPPAECPNGTYENSAGNIVCNPYSSPEQPEGASAECEDGTYSFSESRSGTCSHHGGVKRWLNG
jgi:hypothetical protein